MNNNPTSNISTFLNRNSRDYLERVANFLSVDYLKRTAKLLDKTDRDDRELLEHGFKYKATIYFCGLAGLTLFGTEERHHGDELGAIALEKLLRGEVTKLNDESVALQIKLLFAYPYSNFMHDLLHLEVNEQRYLSTEDMKIPDKYEYTLNLDPKLTIEKIRDSKTFHRLTHSLDRIQTYVDLNQGLWNVPKRDNGNFSPNNIIVKFCPINILCCMLRINNVILGDVYTYSKTNRDAKELALLTPITCLEIPLQSDETAADKQYVDAFCSFLSHFKYLWEHPLTLYSMDATKYRRRRKHLHELLTPLDISYDKKSKRILRKMKETNPSEINNQARADNWKQFIKNELLNNCSKVLSSNNTTIDAVEIQPLKIFIIGSWNGDYPNDFMYEIGNWINKYLSKENRSGLQLKSNILEIKNGEEFAKELYNSLDASHLGVVIQTSDIEDGTHIHSYSKPNVYLEKGYLTGKLRTLKTKFEGKEYQPVFVFKEESVSIETDNMGFGFTKFNKSNFSLKIYEFVFWLWNITQLNSDYTLELMNTVKPISNNELRKFESMCLIIREYGKGNNSIWFGRKELF